MLEVASKRSFFYFSEKNIIDSILTLDPNTYYCTVNGKVIYNFNERVGEFADDDLFELHFRLLGGKGGFGSLLRSFRVNKSTNQLMCRDLNGRRLASIDEEQKLRRWIERAAEREKEKTERRNAKYNKLKAGPPKHMFNDPEYIRQKETIIERTEEAFEQGLTELTKNECEKMKPPIESSSDSDFDIDDLPGSLNLGRKRKGESFPARIENKKQRLDDSDSDEGDIDPDIVKEIREYFFNKPNATTALGNGAPSTSKSYNESLSEYENQPKNCSNSMRNSDTTTESEEILDGENFPEVDLSLYESADELESLGLNHLKHALAARNMKRGGTLKERAARLFSVKNLESDHSNNK
ncbi:hypothetical protein DICVIV_08101 [Dictyocaulus viviparus]|uniref:Uncharacterized protein n=1 Tax=Dictyocaulus viviparus TaxID=29172 RepID=A0A0D8XTZ2_DICVI|nr:hypothetical protein DICVIV_08101 [Dictyocaulus viviparus]